MNTQLLNGLNIGTRVQHDTGANAAALALSTASFSNASVAIGYLLYNQTDGSSTTVTSVTSTTVVGTLSGGAENDWDVNDFGNIPGVARHELSSIDTKYLSIHYKITSGDANNKIYLKLYGTNNPNASISDDTNWVDLSSSVLGATTITATNTSTENIAFIDTPTLLLKYMVKVISECSTGAFSNSYYIYIKQSE